MTQQNDTGAPPKPPAVQSLAPAYVAILGYMHLWRELARRVENEMLVPGGVAMVPVNEANDFLRLLMESLQNYARDFSDVAGLIEDAIIAVSTPEIAAEATHDALRDFARYSPPSLLEGTLAEFDRRAAEISAKNEEERTANDEPNPG